MRSLEASILAAMSARVNWVFWNLLMGLPNCTRVLVYSTASAMAKLTAAQTASDVTRRAVQIFGGYGFTRDYPVERMMRDAKITEIYEGTNEVQKMVIAGAMGVK